MDKTIQLVLVLTVAVVTALIVLMMVTGQSDSFEKFIGGQSDQAKCDLWKSQYESQVCEGDMNSDEFREPPTDSCTAPC